MCKGQRIINKRLKANTLVELLLTMIISGIIFLLVFDGVEIIKKFSYTVNKRIASTQTVLYSHQLMEHLMENADSVMESSSKLLFYREGIVSDSITIGDSFFILESRGVTDTLFAGYLNYRITPLLDRTDQIDSLHINCIVNANDSIWLEYGLPFNRYAYLKSYDDYEDFR